MSERQDFFEAMEADPGRETRQCRWKLAAVMAVVLLLLGAHAPVRAEISTWTTLSEHATSFSPNVTGSRSGAALSANLYGECLLESSSSGPVSAPAAVLMLGAGLLSLVLWREARKLN